jgi:hypothetical protein
MRPTRWSAKVSSNKAWLSLVKPFDLEALSAKAREMIDV